MVNAFYINPFPSCPKVVLSVDDDILLNDKFVEISYRKILENQSIFSKLFAPSTLDISLILQSNPQKRLILSIGFHKQLTSYLGLINYDGNSYKPPKVRLQAYSLFLTYRVFKPKTPKE